MTPQSGYVFRSAGAAGTDPRSWYYMLRDLDPTASRYRAVVFGVDDFDDEDEGEDDEDADEEEIETWQVSDLRPYR